MRLSLQSLAQGELPGAPGRALPGEGLGVGEPGTGFPQGTQGLCSQILRASKSPKEEQMIRPVVRSGERQGQGQADGERGRDPGHVK